MFKCIKQFVSNYGDASTMPLWLPKFMLDEFKSRLKNFWHIEPNVTFYYNFCYHPGKNKINYNFHKIIVWICSNLYNLIVLHIVCDVKSLIHNGTLKTKRIKYKSLSVINKHNDLLKFCTYAVIIDEHVGIL